MLKNFYPIKAKQVFETKWGFVPYTYEDYKKLKRLNFIFQTARIGASQWKRWVRKAPHNRIQKCCIRNEKGQKTGYKIGGPSVEPKICDLFSTKLVDLNRKPLTRWFEGYIRTDHTAELEYRKSHKPVPTQEKVPEAKMSSKDIDKLLKKAEKWFVKRV